MNEECVFGILPEAASFSAVLLSPTPIRCWFHAIVSVLATSSAFAVNFLRNMHSRDLSVEHPSRILSLLFNDPVAGSLNNFANLNRAQFSLVAKLYMLHDPRVSCNLAFPVIRSRGSMIVYTEERDETSSVFFSPLHRKRTIPWEWLGRFKFLPKFHAMISLLLLILTCQLSWRNCFFKAVLFFAIIQLYVFQDIA